jgi:hypothetical protein
MATIIKSWILSTVPRDTLYCHSNCSYSIFIPPQWTKIWGYFPDTGPVALAQGAMNSYSIVYVFPVPALDKDTSYGGEISFRLSHTVAVAETVKTDGTLQQELHRTENSPAELLLKPLQRLFHREPLQAAKRRCFELHIKTCTTIVHTQLRALPDGKSPCTDRNPPCWSAAEISWRHDWNNSFLSCI